jgi:SAM-dependent methyltransferase
MTAADLDRLLEEAECQPFAGWDFSWLAERRQVRPVGWDFAALVVEQARGSPDLLDMGTGGGEWLSRLPHRPRRTVAIEGWAPNVPIAARRLRRLGVAVLHADGARDNVDQQPDEPTGRLPFRDAAFHLVSNRHESFVAREVARVLAPGGQFLTQQVGHGSADDFYRLLGLAMPLAPPRPWSLAVAIEQVEAAGLEVTASAAGAEQHEFADVGALAWYLKAIPWTVPGFTIAAFRPRLAELHQQIQATGPLTVRQPLFWLATRKPPASTIRNRP